MTCPQTQARLPIGCQDVTSRGAGAVVTARHIGAAVGTCVIARGQCTLVNICQEAESSSWRHQMQLTEESQALTVSPTLTGHPISNTQLVTSVAIAPVGAVDIVTVLAAGSG